MNFNNQAWVLPKSFVKRSHLTESDIIITSTNNAREAFNQKCRDIRGSTGPLPKLGDKLVCRKNYRNRTLNGIYLCNGTRGTLINPIRRFECDINKDMYMIDFEPDMDIHKDKDYTFYEALPCDLEYLNQPCGKKEINKYNKNIKMEYAFAITGYLSQGGEYDTVLYWRDHMQDRDFMFRHDYTVATRAKNRFYMAV